MAQFDASNYLIVDDFSVPDNPQTWLCYLKDDDKNNVYDLELWLKTGEIKELSLKNESNTSRSYSEFKTPLNKESKDVQKLLYEERTLIEDVRMSFLDGTLYDMDDSTIKAIPSETSKSPLVKDQTFKPKSSSTPSSKIIDGRLTYTKKKLNSNIVNALNCGSEQEICNEANGEFCNNTFELKHGFEENGISSKFSKNVDEENNEMFTKNIVENSDELNNTFIINETVGNNEAVEDNFKDVRSSGNTNNNINCNSNEGSCLNLNSNLDTTKSIKKPVSRLPQPVNRKRVSKIPTAFKKN
ncbi:hypothetical protein O3M35_004709 [Rhynocoris fuscipes]|uniref:Uncharacterized protein n=1 Tax=Rhynocoris fuscipes TaxID=488301 RepID=A0AAW1CGJ8_9HEMI